MPELSSILTDDEILHLASIKELEQYREAVSPLRVADFGLVREVMGMVAEMSPTMGLIRQTVENLLEMFDPHKPIMDASVITAGDILDSIPPEIAFKEPKRLRFTCKSCGHKVIAYKQKRVCPKCGGKLKQDAH